MEAWFTETHVARCLCRGQESRGERKEKLPDHAEQGEINTVNTVIFLAPL